MFGIRRSAAVSAVAAALGGLSVFGVAPVHAQTPAQPAPPAAERRLSITDAVELALKQNADGTLGLPQASLTHLILHPMARLALHTHPRSLELLYVLKGMARLRTGAGQLTIANAGDVIVAPAGVPHNIEAAPLASLTLIQIFTPAGPEHAYRDARDRTGTVPITKAAASRIVVGNEGLPAMVVAAGSAKSYPIAAGRGEAALLLDGLDLGAASLQRFEAQSGAEVPEHVHDRADELLYIVSGAAEMTIAGRAISVAAGDAIHLPMGTAHALRVTEKLVAVQCYAPSGPEQRFKPKPAPPSP